MGGVCVYSIIFCLSIFHNLVLVLLKSSSRGSTMYRNNTSALGHLAAQHCQLWIVPLHTLHGQKWWCQPVLWPRRRGLAVPVCPWQEKGLRRAERRKSNSPKASGQSPGRSRRDREGPAPAVVSDSQPTVLPVLTANTHRHFPRDGTSSLDNTPNNSFSSSPSQPHPLSK